MHVLQEADHIFIQGLRDWKLYDQVWQAGDSLLSEVRSVGVMGDERNYENAVDYQQGERCQPRLLRHLVQTTFDHRVGVTSTGQGL